jgi:hypothetical protein
MQMVWIILSPNNNSTLPWLSENLLSNPCSSAKLSTPSYLKILLIIFDYPIQHYGIEVFPYQDHGEEVEKKRRS